MQTNKHVANRRHTAKTKVSFGDHERPTSKMAALALEEQIAPDRPTVKLPTPDAPVDTVIEDVDWAAV